MKSLFVLAAAFAATTAFAAQSSSDLGDWDQGNDMMNVETFTANYYDQFLFKVLGDCKEINKVWFQSFSTHEEPIIGKDAQGRDIYVGILINLFADGTYWGEYHEHAVIERITDGYRFDPFFETAVQGKWQVIGNKIVVDNIGEGIPVTVNGVEKVMFKFGKALNDPRIIGNTGIMGRVITNSGPHGESINKFCGVN